MKSKTFLFGVLGLVSSVMLGVQGWTKLSVQAQTEPPLPAPPSSRVQKTTYANYNGRQINLAQSWEDAKACVVVSAKITCFDSYAKADSFELSSKLAPANTSSSARACGTWTYVYEHPNYGGRRLQFRDRGFWQYYGSYNFRNKQSSWYNPRCYGVLLYDIGTGGYYYEWPNAYAGSMGSWDNRADYIYLY